MVDLAKDISQKIRNASRDKIGPIRRGTAGVARAKLPSIGVDWNKTPVPIEFLKHSYVLLREEGLPIDPNDFYRTNAGIARDKLLFPNGNLSDTADSIASVGINVRYSTRVFLPTSQNVPLTFIIAAPAKLYMSYTPLGGAEVPIMYALGDDGRNVYADFYGGDIAIEGLPAGWVQIDIYLYASAGFNYFNESAGALSRVISVSKASISSLPTPPTWNNYCTAVTTSPVSAQGIVVPAALTTEEFPPWGIVYLGAEPISFAYLDDTGLQGVTDLNEDHSAASTIVGGAMWPETPAGVRGQSLVDFNLSWNLPVYDADGFPLKDAITINLFEVVFEAIDGILEIGDNYIMTSRDVSAELSVGDSLRIVFEGGAYYECVVSGVVVSGSQTKISFSVPVKQWVKDYYDAVYEASVCRARRTKLSEFRGNATTEKIQGIPRIGSKHYCLSASVYEAGESAYSDVCSNYTFPRCAPPNPIEFVKLIGGNSFIVVELPKEYFDAYPHIYISDIKLSVLASDSSTRKDSVPDEVQIYSGIGEPFSHTYGPVLRGDQSISDVYFHFYLVMTSGAGFTSRFWLGCTQLGANVVAPDPPVLTADNFIVNFDDLDDEPFAEEAMQQVSSILSAPAASEDKISPVVVAGVEKPAQAGLTVDIACRPAVYWGVISEVDMEEERAYASEIHGEDDSTQFASSLRGLVMIDANGNMFTIRGNTTTRINFFWSTELPVPVIGEFGVIKMPTTIEDEGGFVPQVPVVKSGKDGDK